LKRPKYKYFLAFIDWGIVCASFAAAYLVRQGTIENLVRPPFPYITWSSVIIGVVAAAAVLIFKQFHLYKVNVFLSIGEQSIALGKGLFFAILGVALISFFTKWGAITESRLVLFYFFSFGLAALSLMRIAVFRPAFRILSGRNILRRKVIIVGTGWTAKFVAATILHGRQIGISIVGFLDGNQEPGSSVFEDLNVLGSVEEAPVQVSKYRADELIICVDQVSHGRFLEIVDLCKSAHAFVRIATPMFDVIPERIYTERYGDVPIIDWARGRSLPLWHSSKRVFDVFGATVALVLFAPLFLLIAISIKLTSRGPVIFRQKRIGKKGGPFEFLKFRSMTVGSHHDWSRERAMADFIKGNEENSGPSRGKVVNEERVTAVGRFLRKTSLDELPQLFNVLRGDMSLVGPRPCLPYEWEDYEQWHKRRLDVLPGCTGVWQVNGRSEVGFRDMVILDLYYVYNASLLLDLQLILKTFYVMASGRGGR